MEKQGGTEVPVQQRWSTNDVSKIGDPAHMDWTQELSGHEELESLNRQVDAGVEELIMLD